MEGAGHSNSCIGLGQALLRRGHKVIFLTSSAMSGQFAKLGFGEILLTSSAQVDTSKPKAHPVAEFAQMILNTGLLSSKPPIEKLKCHFIGANNFLEQICSYLTEFNGQIEEAIKREAPDTFILAQFLTPPAILSRSATLPWIYHVPFNPLGLYTSPNVPPFFSGFPSNSDPASWAEFRAVQEGEYLDGFRQYQKKLNDACGYKGSAEASSNKSFFLKSPYLNTYCITAELDYTDLAPAPEKSVRMDDSCREEEIHVPLALPESFATPKDGSSLIYFSLGSMGSIDVPLVKRILSVLATTPHRYIVSKGPRAEEYDLPENCWGEAYLPQTRVLPLVDLVITHGGHNSVSETMTFGKPMIVFPLFSDQYDNAQRLDEKKFGIRLDPHAFTADQLVTAIEQLLADQQLKERLLAVAERIKRERSKDRACLAIETMVAEFKETQQVKA